MKEYPENEIAKLKKLRAKARKLLEAAMKAVRETGASGELGTKAQAAEAEASTFEYRMKTKNRKN